jgi:hypothetical protein
MPIVEKVEHEWASPNSLTTKPVTKANSESPNRRDHCRVLMGVGGAEFAGIIRDTEGIKYHTATTPLPARMAKNRCVERQAPG